MDSRTPKIAVFGHYGNSNLGDEAIIEAALKNLRRLRPDAELECFSINPGDSQARHGVKAFPIRYRQDWFNPVLARQKEKARPGPEVHKGTPSHSARQKIKQALKRMPLTGAAIAGISRAVSLRQTVQQEFRFVKAARRHLADFDLLLITGSNQFLDNFGGPWGFPYTLLKWSWVARKTNTRLAFVSVGAGPIYKRLSYLLLKQALKHADFISFRDEGSRQLIRQNTGIDGEVFPDIAHSLTLQSPARRPASRDRLQRIVAVNPMPVFDRRYWYHVDDDKYRRYVSALADFCALLLAHGEEIILFNTQLKDENVIDDVLRVLESKEAYPHYKDRLKASRNREVDELMDVMSQADVVVATRFHATVLPVQLGKPVMGICYYRKSIEQLIDIGLADSYMEIEQFDADRMFDKYQHLVLNYAMHEDRVRDQADRYRSQLDAQYRRIIDLLQPEAPRSAIAEAPQGPPETG